MYMPCPFVELELIWPNDLCFGCIEFQPTTQHPLADCRDTSWIKEQLVCITDHSTCINLPVAVLLVEKQTAEYSIFLGVFHSVTVFVMFLCFVAVLRQKQFPRWSRMSQTVDEDVIFDDIYELCDVIGRWAQTTHDDKCCCRWFYEYWIEHQLT